MAYFAVLDENNVILNLIVADSLFDAETVTEKPCVEYNLPIIGGTYVDGKFNEPVNEILNPIDNTPAE